MFSKVHLDPGAEVKTFAATGHDVRYLLDIKKTADGLVQSIKLMRAVDAMSPDTLFEQEYPVVALLPKAVQPKLPIQLPAGALNPVPVYNSPNTIAPPSQGWNISVPPAGGVSVPSGGYNITWNGYGFSTVPAGAQPVVPEEVILDAPIPPLVQHRCLDILYADNKAAWQATTKTTIIRSELGTYRIYHGEIRDIRVDIAGTIEELHEIEQAEHDLPFILDTEDWVAVPLYLI